MERTLQVRYAPPGAPSRLCMLQVSPATDVAQIKLELLVEFGIDLPLQKLMSGNIVLEDERTIEELKLSDRDVLTVVNLADDFDDMPGLIDTGDHKREPDRLNAANQSAAGAGDKPAAAVGGGGSNGGGVEVKKDVAVHTKLPLDTGSVVIIDSDDDEDGVKRRTNDALVGLRNQGATCYLNVLVQALYLTPEFRAMLYALPTAPREEQKKDNKDNKDNKGDKGEKGEAVEKIAPDPQKDELIYQLQVLFAHLQAGVNASASTEGLTRSFGWNSNDVGVQHDVHELNRVLCDRLEELMRALPPEAPAPPYNIASLYRGVLCSTVKCQHCGYSSGREEEVYDVPLVVKGHADVYQCLDAFTAPELLDGDNAYSCERCAVKRPATRSLTFRTLPAILNVQLLRFEYEPSTGRREKVAHAVLFPQLLAMDKYMLPSEALAEVQVGEEALKEGEQEAMVRGRVLYELQAVLVHCGTASVGHYLAFVYHLEQKRWFRFNDETVTPLDAADIFSHRWLESGVRAEFGLAQALTQPAPYMLVYRHRAARVLPRLENQEVGVERVALAAVAAQQVPDESIPKHIHAILIHDAAKRAAEQLERKQARETVTVTVFRNRTWLPSISVRAHPTSPLEMLRMEIISQAEALDEQAILLNFPLGGGEARYRLRRMVVRENDTSRPGNLFTAADESATLEALRVTDKRMIYLEQDNVGWPFTDEELSEEAQVGRVFITVRKWDERMGAPGDLADVLVPKRHTVGMFKDLIARRFRLGTAHELLLVEEETEEKFTMLMDDHLTLEKCGLRTGDVVYAERISERSYKQGMLVSQVQDYRMARRNQMEVWFEETHTSFRARSKPGVGPQVAAEWRDKRARVGCTTYGGNSVAQVKDFVATRLGIGADYLRIRALDPKGVREARLIKEPASLFSAAVTFGHVCATELQLIVLAAPEMLRKGDKILEVRFYNDSGAFVLTADVVLNKHASIRELKRQLASQFGVPAERQLLSEWYDNRLYQVFANELLSPAQCRIRSGDVLRLDALPLEAHQVGGAEAAVAMQVCVGAGWNLTASGHKELNFVGPFIVTCRMAITRGDFEELLRVRCKLHASAPMQLFRVSRLPIIESDIRPFVPLPSRALDAHSAALVSMATSEAVLPLRVYDVHNCDILALLIDIPRTSSGPSASDPTSTPASQPLERPKETSLVIK